MKDMYSTWECDLAWKPKPGIDFDTDYTSNGFEERSAKLIKNTPDPWSSKELLARHKAYCEAYEEQQAVVESMFVHVVGKKFLRGFPKLTKVRISEINGSEQRWCNDRGPTWLAKHHPDVLIKGLDISLTEDHDAANHFVYKVFEVLKAANISPVELSFGHGHGLGPKFRWHKLPNCQLISDLKRLHLSIRGADESDDKVDSGWFAFLKPLQAYVTGIEYLYIHVVHDILELEHSNNEVLNIVRLPRLKEFHFDCLGVKGESYARFLHAHPLLEELSGKLNTPTDAKWRAIWRAIGTHPKLSRFTLTYEPPIPLWSDEVSLITTKGEPEMSQEQREREWDVHEALYKFIHKKGPWTDELSALWH